MNTAKKKFWGRAPSPPPPPSNTTLLDPIIHINTEKNQFQNIPATKYTILHASSLHNVMQNMDSQVVLPLLFNPRTTPPPFFFAFKKFVAVENKYSVLDLLGNKFFGRARDENK